MENITGDVASQQEATAAARSGVIRVIRFLGWTSIVAGLLLLGFVVQQLFVTDFFAARHQATLEEELEVHFAGSAPESIPFVPGVGLVTEPDGSAPVVVPGDVAGFYLREAAPAEGEALGTIRIPSITLRGGEPMQWTFIEGTSLRDLKNGAGHMIDTALPGQFGNAVISGHRTTYGAPFHNLDQLETGALIEVVTAIGTHVYAVREVRVVQPTALWVAGTTDERLAEVTGEVAADPRQGAWLTLTTCHPKFSARERLIVFAELVDGPNAAVVAASLEDSP